MTNSLPTLILFVSLSVGTQAYPSSVQVGAASEKEPYLSWRAEQAVALGKHMRVSGRVGGLFDFRVVHTERSYNYKLRATWLTAEVIRASARLIQIQSRLTDDQARALVVEADAAGDTVVMVEIDPREGAGVIPAEWLTLLQPKDLLPGMAGGVRGVNTPKLRNVKALAGVMQRDYDYDIFWVVFPLVNEKGEPIFPDSVRNAELVVRIYNKEGRVTWQIPDSIR